jgi:hypothetical protein
MRGKISEVIVLNMETGLENKKLVGKGYRQGEKKPDNVWLSKKNQK